MKYYQDVSLPSEYATQVLDKNHTGLISIQQIEKDPLLLKFLPLPHSLLRTNNTKAITTTIAKVFGTNGYILPHSLLRTNNTKAITTTIAKVFGTNGYISIDKQLKPFLIKAYENTKAFNLLKCNTTVICPILWRALSNMTPNLSIIGNVSKSTGILMLNGENDSLTPVQQAFLLQQRLTDVNHPDHSLISYPNLGHVFYPSSHWLTGIGPIEPYVLADIYTWLEAHSGLSHSSFTTASTIGANTSSLNTSTTSPSKR